MRSVESSFVRQAIVAAKGVRESVRTSLSTSGGPMGAAGACVAKVTAGGAAPTGAWSAGSPSALAERVRAAAEKAITCSPAGATDTALAAATPSLIVCKPARSGSRPGPATAVWERAAVCAATCRTAASSGAARTPAGSEAEPARCAPSSPPRQAVRSSHSQFRSTYGT